MPDEMLLHAVAYKHDNIISEENLNALKRSIIPLDDISTLNNFIIHYYGYAHPDTQFSIMTDFLTAVVEELDMKFREGSYWWNVAETRSLVDLSIVHVFNKVLNRLELEGYIHAQRYAKGVITEATLVKTKESILYRLDGS